MTEQTNVPKRRFKEYQNTDVWEQRTVSELADRYDNLRVPITASDRVAGSTPYYGANGIQDYVEGFTHDGEFILVAEDGANDLQNYPVHYVNGKVWVNNHAHVLQAKSEIADNKFLMYAFKQTNIEPYLVGGGRAKLNADVMMKISFRVPELAEQKQIGSFFANLDHLITLYQRKLEKTKALKTAYLFEMFPVESEHVPKRRFAGFTQDWEQFKLGELCQIGDIDHRMPKSVKDGIPYIMTGDFFGINDIDFSNSKLISPEDYEQLAKKIKPESGDILFARYASVGMVRYVETKIKFLVSYSCAILKPNDIANGKYLFYYLQANEAQRQIELEINTGSQRNIGIDSLKKLIILLPQKKEQEKVATFFTKLDNLINLHQRQLEKLQNLKKAFLNEMFI